MTAWLYMYVCVCVFVCVVILVVTHNAERMVSVYESKLHLSDLTANRFVLISVDFHIRK